MLKIYIKYSNFIAALVKYLKELGQEFIRIFDVNCKHFKYGIIKFWKKS